MRNRNTQINTLFFIVDIVSTILSYVLSWYIFVYIRVEDNVGVLPFYIYFRALYIIIPIYLILYSFFGLYYPDRTRNRLKEFSKIFEASIIATLIITLFLFLGRKNPYLQNFSTIMIISFCVVNIFITFGVRLIIRKFINDIRKRGFNQRHILLVGYSDACFKFIDKVKRNPGWGYYIHGIVDDNRKVGTDYRNIKVIDKIENLQKIIEENNFDEIAITLSLDEYEKLKFVVNVCEKSGVHTKFVPDYGTIIPTTPVSDDLDGLPVINIRAVPLTGLFNRFLKRTVDIIGSLAGIIIFGIPMIVIAIAIKCTSKGRIIFAQERVGCHNKLFTMYKFRSMVEQNEEDEKKRWTTIDDDRVTKVGKIIRKISFDELPQFFNVLKGDMSLVGPRPERLQYVEKFKEIIPRYMIKHQVRPGMTGWAQVNGLRGDTPIDKRIQYDLWYIENWTLGLDIKIMILTIFFGFVNKNAY